MASLKFIQAQSFILQASGQAIGDTSIILQSFKMINGTTNIVTADLGDKCYGTLEPNNGTQEEAIQFTGVTQNANGTATLTGVSSVGFNSPYTVTSGLAKSHAGGVTFILSNDAAFYGNIKTYIDTVVASGAAFADSTTVGITKLSVSPVTGSNPIAVGDNDSRIPGTTAINYLNGIVQTSIPYAVATGTANAFTATLSSAISSLASGTHLNFLVPATNATAATLNVNSLGAKSLVKNVSTTLASADILKGQVVSAVFDGTNFQITSPLSLPPATAGTTTKDISSSTSTTIAHGLGASPRIVELRGGFGNTITSSVASLFWTSISGNAATSIATKVTATVGAESTSTFKLRSNWQPSSEDFIEGTVTVDATNITIAWSKSNSPTGTANISWIAIA